MSIFRTRMTGVYNKFRVTGSGSGKKRKLDSFLREQYGEYVCKLNPHQKLQEYIDYITKGSLNDLTMEDDNLRDLVRYLINPRLKKTFLVIAAMMFTSDGLLRSFKKQIDELLAQDETLQSFLEWVDEKSQALLAVINDRYKLVAIRACYLDFDIAIDPDRTLGWFLDRYFTRNFTCASFIARAEQSSVLRTFDRLHNIPELSNSPDLDHAMAITLARAKIIEKLLERLDLDDETLQNLLKLKKIYLI